MIKFGILLVGLFLLVGCKDSYLECNSKENLEIINKIINKNATLDDEKKKNILIELKDVATISLDKELGNRECMAYLNIFKDNIEVKEKILYKILKLKNSDSTHQLQITSSDSFDNLIYRFNNELNLKAFAKEAQKAGFDNPQKYKEYTKAKNELSLLLNELSELEKLKTDNNIFKDSKIYTEKNNYIEIVAFHYDNNNGGMMEMTIKNISQYPIIYFWNSYYLYDDEGNQKNNFKLYEENILIPANSLKTFKYSRERNGLYFFSSDVLRLFAENKKLKLYVVPSNITYQDNFGQNKITLDKNQLKILEKISSKKFNTLQEKIKRVEANIVSLEEQKNKP